MMNGARRRAGIALGAILVVTTPASTQGRDELALLSTLQPGRWELRDIDNDRAAPRSMCIADPGILTQIQHRASPCSRLVIGSDTNSVTVHYTCPAGGFGRTTVRVNSPRSARLETQGIDRGRPFEYRNDLRRIGRCAR